MRQIIHLNLLVVLCGLALASCKKGEDDPFLTLRTRKARLAGKWTVTRYDGTETFEGQDVNGLKIFTYQDGVETMHSRYASSDGSSVNESYDTTAFTIQYAIEKDGSFMKTITYQDGGLHTYEGYWTFMHKSKGNDLKNKEAVQFIYTSENEDGEVKTSDQLGGEIVQIEQLKNKEIIWKTGYSFNYDGPGGTFMEDEKRSYDYTIHLKID